MTKLRKLIGWRLYLVRARLEARLERDCPECLGRGITPDDRICPACNGRGWQQLRFGWKPAKERGKGMDDQVANWRARLQAELDALRAQIAEGKAEPETTSAQDATKTPEPAPVNSGEAIDPVPTQEASP